MERQRERRVERPRAARLARRVARRNCAPRLPLDDAALRGGGRLPLPRRDRRPLHRPVQVDRLPPPRRRRRPPAPLRSSLSSSSAAASAASSAAAVAASARGSCGARRRSEARAERRERRPRQQRRRLVVVAVGVLRDGEGGGGGGAAAALGGAAAARDRRAEAPRWRTPPARRRGARARPRAPAFACARRQPLVRFARRAPRAACRSGGAPRGRGARRAPRAARRRRAEGGVGARRRRLEPVPQRAA